ncbi:MAG TPA: hypothetical protein VNL16_03515 [Chloroflexota bacterium]|nr:hypothetical protein [Chloroflexota bacterium]
MIGAARFLAAERCERSIEGLGFQRHTTTAREGPRGLPRGGKGRLERRSDRLAE